MAILPIVKYGEPVLRKRARPVPRIDAEVRRLMEDMVETMLEAPGIGLAAPQIGQRSRIIVAQIEGDEVLMLANPRIIETAGEQEAWEACLSLPGLQGKVVRPARVVVRGVDQSGKTVTIEATDLAARCLCHEIDHLHGIVFADRSPDDAIRWVFEAGKDPETGEPQYAYEYVTREEAFAELVRRWRAERAKRRAQKKG